MFFDNIKTENEIDVNMNQFGVIECTEENVEIALYQIALENEQNFQNINTAIMSHSFNCLCECEGYVTEAEQESKVKKILNAIKEAIKKFWSKIMGVFKRLNDNISLAISNNKGLIDKLKTMGEKDLKDVKIPKCYTFKKLDTPYYYDNYEKVAEYLSSKSPKYSIRNDKFEIDGDTIKGGMKSSQAYPIDEKYYDINEVKSILLDEEKYDGEDFQNDLKLLFYGEETEINLSDINKAKLILEIETAKASKESIKNTYEKSKSAIKKYLKDVERIGKIIANDKSDNKALLLYSNFVNKSISVMSQALAVHTSAIAARYRQNVKIAQAMITFKVVDEK